MLLEEFNSPVQSQRTLSLHRCSILWGSTIVILEQIRNELLEPIVDPGIRRLEDLTRNTIWYVARDRPMHRMKRGIHDSLTAEVAPL